MTQVETVTDKHWEYCWRPRSNKDGDVLGWYEWLRLEADLTALDVDLIDLQEVNFSVLCSANQDSVYSSTFNCCNKDSFVIQDLPSVEWLAGSGRFSILQWIST